MTSVLLLGKAESLRSTALFMIKATAAVFALSLLLGLSSVNAQTKEPEPKAEEKLKTQINEVIQQCARAKLHFAYRQENLTAHYAIAVNNDLRASEAKITHPSGDKAFDQAVLNALAECAEYPETLRNSTFEGIFNYTR